MAIVIQELNHVAIRCRNLQASVHFYGVALGLPKLARPNFSFDGAWFALGAQELHLIDDPQLPAKEQVDWHYAMRVADAGEVRKHLEQAGLTKFKGPKPRPDGAMQLFVEDPDGNLLEFVSY